MKKLILILLLFFMSTSVFADTGTPPTPVSTGYMSIENCIKTYNTTSEKLFLLTLSAITNNNYHIEEIQSESGYILFTAYNRNFLASVSKISQSYSQIKIMPENNNFYFPAFIVEQVYTNISQNLKTPVIMH